MTTIPVQNPPAANETPYMPPGPSPITFDTFSTVNTQASRPAINDDQVAWADGFMLFGKSNARTMPGVGTLVHSEAGLSVIWFDFVNIGATPYMIVLHNDGSLHGVNTDTLVSSAIAPAGTVLSPSQTQFDLTQWGSQYALMVANQTNGYFAWDGNAFYSPGTLSPQITVVAGGASYSAPTFTVSGGAGSGASIGATLLNGAISGASFINPGAGYSIGNTVTITVHDSTGSGASLAATIMPFGIQGNAIETFTNRIWIAKGATVTFSAPGSFTDTSTANGGGTFTSNDSFLRVGFTTLRQSNGFLYLIGDSSINYISGVQTGGSPLTTTFTNQNADPEVGTPWPGTVDVIGSNIVFANPWGAHVSYGGRTAKVSDAMDGVYNTVPNFGDLIPTGAKAIVFGKRIWCLLLPIIDPVNGQQQNKILCWDTKQAWWATLQDVTLQFIQHQEINSVLTAYGSTGNAIYKLFQQPSTAFSKVLQSKLWDRPHQIFVKGESFVVGMANYFSIQSPGLTISIDNEKGASSGTITAGPQQAVIVNNSGNNVVVVNSVPQIVAVLVGGVGISVFGPASLGQNGVLAGLTLTTNAADVAIISLAMDSQIAGRRGS